MSAYKGSLRTYNELYRKGDEIYHSAVKAFDISDGAFWVLHTLRDIGPQPTQRDVYKSTCMPKQTVNSALNRLESEGFIELHGETGSRTRTISLTESGEALARRTADKLRAAEFMAMSELPEGELVQLLELTRKYTDALAASVKSMIADIKSEATDAANGENTK